MTRKLLVTIALGAVLAIVAAGTASSLSVGGATVSTPTSQVSPSCQELVNPIGLTQALESPGCGGTGGSTTTTGGGGGSGGSTTTTGGGGGTGSTTTTTGGGGGTGSTTTTTTGTSGKAGK